MRWPWSLRGRYRASMGWAGAVRRAGIRLLAAAATAWSCGCAIPELNLSPLYFHRLDPDGQLRELDILWPIFHWERREDGGRDCRIRPFYRSFTEPHERTAEGGPAVEHQFAWPLGRVREARGETLSRLFPLFWHRTRDNDRGQRDTDWNLLLLLWGGGSTDGSEDYFAFLPFYADIPNFLTYDRFRVHLFPLHVGLTKNGLESHIFLWPFVGFGSDASGRRHWHRVLPLYSVNLDKDKFERYSILWPLINFGREELDTDDPIRRFLLFPLYGWQKSRKVNAWTVLWPLFQKVAIHDRLLKLDLLWPFFRYFRDTAASQQITQVWFWPFYGQANSPTQRSWSALWPLIWVREYDDPEGTQDQQWVLPVYWRVHRERDDGTADDHQVLWPLYHRTRTHDGYGRWNSLSVWPWRGRFGAGFDELYGWLWTLAKGRRHPEGTSVELTANLYTSARRGQQSQGSVPLFANWESDAHGTTIRLFQFLPLRFGGARPAPPDSVDADLDQEAH